MAANSSTGFLPSSSVTMYSILHECFRATVGTISITVFTITSFVFLLPLYIFVLYQALQRWRQQRSGTTMSHSDVFIYHMAVIELMSIFGCTLICFSVYTDLPELITAGTYLFSFNFIGQMLLHVLTCVERYLAVVHPVTYLSLRKAKGIRIRNISIGCTWLLCFTGIALMSMTQQDVVVIFSLCNTVLCFALVFFCSLSVLYVLIRPGPGEGGGGRQRVDQSKLRAFYTIVAILGALVFRFGGAAFSTALYKSLQQGKNSNCNLWSSTNWFSLPSSLVLPLLSLQRGKLLCCKSNNEPGHGSD